MIVSIFVERPDWHEESPAVVVCVRPHWSATPKVVARCSSYLEAVELRDDLRRHPDLAARLAGMTEGDGDG